MNKIMNDLYLRWLADWQKRAENFIKTGSYYDE